MGPNQIVIDRTEFDQLSHLTVDSENRTVQLDERLLRLTPKEFDLLDVLMRHNGEVVPRAVLLLLVWGYSPAVRTRTLDVHIGRLRKQLGYFATRSIETVVGVGYRLRHPTPTLFDKPNIEPCMDLNTSVLRG